MLALLALTLIPSMSPAAPGAILDPLRSLPAPDKKKPVPSLPLCIGGQITADNSYIIGVGGPKGIKTVLQSACNTTAADIFSCTGPEGFGMCFLNVKVNSYIYIVAWGDDLITNGVLASILVNRPNSTGTTRYSGNPAWQVYPTGVDIDDCTAPSIASVNGFIKSANTQSKWVGVNPTLSGVLQVGEYNLIGSGNLTCSDAFPWVCGMSQSARWMWYRELLSPCAFTGGNHHEYLIFRIPILAFYPF